MVISCFWFHQFIFYSSLKKKIYIYIYIFGFKKKKKIIQGEKKILILDCLLVNLGPQLTESNKTLARRNKVDQVLKNWA